MFFEPSVWDWILIALSGYVAVAALVYMMRDYQKKMVIQLKTTLLRRQMSQKSKRPDADELG
ncbi:MAG: hypothetical protein JNK57_08015 [Planctomycetaceae bacterium]|nr:hypothetical protein [Planctomycetaceae bacterium]